MMNLFQDYCTLLRDHPLIVIGYRGAEPSVMQHLLTNHAAEAEGYRHGIYWCTYKKEGPNNLTPLVHKLARKIQGNFQVVPIGGFDEVMNELWEYVRQQPLDFNLTRITASPEESTSLPYDITLVKEASIDDFESTTLKSRLVQYCEKMDIRVPPIENDDLLIQLLCDQELASRTEAGIIFPTVGGYLLFAQTPQSHIQSAQVTIRVKGNPEWMGRVFGDENDDDEIIGNQMERTIKGNLWSQRDMIFDILSLVNQPFPPEG